MVYRREKIKLKNGTIVKEREWLNHWKKGHKAEVDEIRERIKKEHPDAKEKRLEQLVDAEILDPVWEGPEAHSDGSNVVYFQDYKGWDLEYKPEEEELIPQNYEKLYELLGNLKYEEIIKMRFGLDGYDRHTLQQIAEKTGYAVSGVHKAIQIALKIMRNNLKK